MSSVNKKKTEDGMWEIELTAFSINLFVYKSIGSTIVARHKETTRSGLFGWWGKEIETWRERPVRSLAIENQYSGLLANLSSGVAFRSSLCENHASCDERLFSFGLSISVNDGRASSGADLSSAMVGPWAELEIRRVVSRGSAIIDGQIVEVGPVEAGTPM